MAAPKLFDRVLQEFTTTGTGTISLGSALDGYQSFSGAGANSSDTVAYLMVDSLSSPVNWEVGEGVWTSGSPAMLTRATIRASSNGGSAVNWGAGTKYVGSCISAAAFQGMLTASLMAGLHFSGHIVESHSANAATFVVKDFDDNTPSASTPVYYRLPDGTLVTLTSAVSITIPSTATMGAVSAKPFKLWFELLYDAGTTYLGVRNCRVDPTGTPDVRGFPGNGRDTSTTISTAADNAGVTYTSTGVTAKPAVLVGCAEYESGLTTAGTWDAAPSLIFNWLPGMAKPGDRLQTIGYAVFASDGTASTSFVATLNTRGTVTPVDVYSVILISMSGSLVIGGSAETADCRMSRGTTNNTNMFGSEGLGGGTPWAAYGYTCVGTDAPMTVSSVVYALQIRSLGGNGIQTASASSQVTMEEICA